jgi:large subunit ribosomal protein L9
VRVGAQGRLYGSVTAQDIAERLKSVAGLEVDRRSIDLKEPLRALGDFDVPVQVAHAVTAHLKVTLRDQNAPVVEPPAAPSPVGDAAAAEATGSEPQGASTGSSATSST